MSRDYTLEFENSNEMEISFDILKNLKLNKHLEIMNVLGIDL